MVGATCGSSRWGVRFDGEKVSMAEDGAHPLNGLLSIELDYEASTVTFLRDDLQIGTTDFSPPLRRGGVVTKSTFFPQQSRMEFSIPGHTLTMNLGTVLDRCEAPTIYLDQRDWIQFSRWEQDPDRVTPGQRRFFATLAAAATSEQVVVPLSGAHLQETSKRGGSSRLQLASTMLKYCRGWQMRSVLVGRV